MSFGIEIYNEQGVRTLGMGDFTIRKIFEAEVAGAYSGPGWTNGDRSDYVSLTVPGYDPSKCFVIITPRSYNSSNQSASSGNAQLMTPTYIDVGGQVIGIIRYQRERWFDQSNQVYRNRWKLCAPASLVEVFEVF